MSVFPCVKLRTAAENRVLLVGESSGNWVYRECEVGGVDVFLLLNTHGWGRLCKCVNLIFKRTALFFAQWKWTAADTWL